MATRQLSNVIQHVRRATLLYEGEAMTDGELLSCFIAEREEAAFAVLVRRHGPMVLAVCRRVLHNIHDAEDAFQATFLVLVQKASAFLSRGSIGNWLYGVAYHTALKARAASARRRTKETQVTANSERESSLEVARADWLPLLDRELSKLADNYREALVLCDLQGKTRREAAEQLGIPEGTLSGRLTTARRKLAARLTRCGVTLSAGLLAALLTESTASACVPMSLANTTVKAATSIAGGEAAADVISVKVVALTEGVMKTMSMTRIKMTAALLVMAGLFVAGSGTLAHRALAAEPAESPVVSEEQYISFAAAEQDAAKEGKTVGGKLEAVDSDKNTVTISIFTRSTATSTDHLYTLAKDAKILRDGKETKLKDLKKGGRATLVLSDDEKSVVSVTVVGNVLQTPLKAIDAEKNTITIVAETRQGKVDRTFQVAKDAKITAEGKEVKLSDLKKDTTVVLTFLVDDDKTVIQIGTPARRNR